MAITKSADCVGKTFGRLRVTGITYKPQGKQRAVYFLCECECGNITEVWSNDVKRGKTKSCGCLNDEGRVMNNTTHGQTGTKLHRTWKNILTRCYNTNFIHYGYYGGRGISVCAAWRNSFESFRDWALVNGHSDDLTLDRVDVDGNYDPDNCRWVDRTAQSRNRRMLKHNTSGVNGVSYKASINKWQVSIGVDNQRVYVGVYDTLEEAAVARKGAEIKYW